ncbi:Hsp70 family protein [Candidatus Ferrigenium straubiae]|jgi:molecular chaperone DnaK (HSP70)|uniref:Hsp70 family protein n=1 Tax=Candidatus Ferrigenium straubiae TaxID=2919506 RepID=UPI003F4AA214
MTLALDFGTCNTVLVRWNPATRRAETLRLDGLTKTYRYRLPGENSVQESAVIPSLAHYGESHTLRTGAEVENAGLASHRGTFSKFKLDILRDNNRARRIHGDLITPRQAGEDLIGQILMSAANHAGEDLVVTLPVEAYDKYADWLQDAVLKSYHGTVRMLDEATACILGYGEHVREGQVYVVFDFGGGTLDVSVVKTRDMGAGETQLCDVLGRAGEEIGGALVDQWLLRRMQEAKQLTEDDLADVGVALLHAVEDAKIRLSGGEERVEIEQFNDITGRLIGHAFTVTELRELLERPRPELRGVSLYGLVVRTLDRALETARKYGTEKSQVRAVFLAGGSSLLLGIAQRVREQFGGCPVHCESPFEAVARGACRYAGEDLNQKLVHDYCLRSWDREAKDYVLVPVVPKGTAYPTEGTVSNKFINAACEGATRLGLVVTERSVMVRPETVYEIEGGSLRPVQVLRREDIALRQMNPGDSEFIHADPPCTLGEKRFVAGFGIDANKRLTLSLKDLHPDSRSYVQLSSGEKMELPVKNMPFVKL